MPTEIEPASDALVQEIRAGLDVVTPRVWPDAGSFETCNGDHAHIARCSPDNIAALLARLDAAEFRASAESAARVAAEARAERLTETIERLNNATARSTNSATADQAFSFVRALTSTALSNIAATAREARAQRRRLTSG